METDDNAFELGYRAGCEAARAAIASDLKCLADHFAAEIVKLRREIYCLAGWPMPPALGDGHELQ